MTATKASAEFERILLALDVCGVSPVALDRIVRMAAQLDAELEGLFVEDAELLRAAELPFAVEVAAAGRERALSVVELQRANRDASLRVRQLLEDLAVRSNVRWRFATAHGHRVRSALEMAVQSDLLLPARPPRVARPVAEGDDEFRRVSFLHDASRQAERAISVVAALTQSGHTREVVVLSQGGGRPSGLGALEGQGLRIFEQRVTAADCVTLLRELAGSSAGGGLIIVPRRLLACSSRAEVDMLDELRSALLLLR